MKSEALLALFVKLLDERFAELSSPVAGPRGMRGPRGQDGRDGADGKSFDFAEIEPKVRAWAKEFALKFSDLSAEDLESLRGRPGRDGRDGRDGESFSFDANLESIKAILEEQKLKFEDFTPEQISLLTGPRGQDGRGFSFEEHADQIRAWVAEQKLKFSDFTEDEIAQLRGPRGREGRAGSSGQNGKDFSFVEHAEEIRHILAEAVAGLTPDLKLKFSDLSDDEKEQLRGRRGQRGKAGRDFELGEHVEYFKSLVPKFEDFTPEEREQLKLHFRDLSEDERDSLRLKFQNLTDEERLMIRGPRGQRGKAGRDGADGPRGERGQSIRGLPGPMGLRGLTGASGTDGRDGEDGLDAPRITDVSVVERRGEYAFVFSFDDGSEIRTNFVPVPAGNVYVAGGGFISGGDGSGSGGTGADGKSAYQIWLDEGHTGTVSDFLASLVGATGPQGTQGDQGPQGFPGADGASAYQTWLNLGNSGTEADFIASLKGPKGDPGDSGDGSVTDALQVLRNIPCSSDVFVSSCVRMSESDYVEGHMAEWPTLSSVVALRSGTYNSKAINAIASSYKSSNVIGIVVGKPTVTTCDIRIAGIAQGIFYGLDVAEEYYLSDDNPGRIVVSSAAPTENEHVFLKIGQPTAFDSLLFLRGERLVRAALADENT